MRRAKCSSRLRISPCNLRFLLVLLKVPFRLEVLNLDFFQNRYVIARLSVSHYFPSARLVISNFSEDLHENNFTMSLFFDKRIFPFLEEEDITSLEEKGIENPADFLRASVSKVRISNYLKLIQLFYK